MIKNISNLGDAALYCDFGKEVNKDINTQVIKYFKTIQKKNIAGVNNITPSYNKLIISFDLKKINFNKLKKIIDNIEIIKGDSIQNKKFEIAKYAIVSLGSIWNENSFEQLSNLESEISNTSLLKCVHNQKLISSQFK